MFSAKAGTNYDGINIPTLPPGIYNNCKLIDIKKDTSTPKDGGTGTKILTWTVEAPGHGLHQHTEWDIKADDPKLQQKSDNMVTRLGHLLRQFGIPQTTLDAMPQFADFESYCNWVIATLGQSHQGVTFDFKVVGNVYSGKATSDIPGYIPYMASGKGGTKVGSLSFSANEVSQNAAYAKATNATPDQESSSGSTGDSTGALKDSDF